MRLWEITTGLIDRAAMLVVADDYESDFERSKELAKRFDLSGAPLYWSERPKLGVFVDKRSKKPKPRADISPFKPGALVLSEKAYQALNDFLSPFGQLLEVEVEGHVEYYYNVTNMISCLDRAKSTIQPFGFCGIGRAERGGYTEGTYDIQRPGETNEYLRECCGENCAGGATCEAGCVGDGLSRNIRWLNHCLH